MPREFTKERIKEISQLVFSIEQHLRFPSILSLLARSTITSLPIELKAYLEELFFQKFGSLKKEGSIWSFIVADDHNPTGSLTIARRLDEETLQAYGFDAATGEEEYIAFLKNISQSIALAPEHRLELTFDKARYLIKRGVYSDHSQKTGCTEIPFTGMHSPLEEPDDIGIYRWDESLNDGKGGWGYSLVTIPSNWQELVETYGFYEYNSDFSFGPSKILPIFLTGFTLEQRKNAFTQLNTLVKRKNSP